MMAFLMIVCVKLLLLMLLALDCSFAYNFQSGSNGQIMWASGCDFIGKYIGNQAGLGEICGDLYALLIHRVPTFRGVTTSVT